MKICGLDLVYTLFVGSFYIVDLSQSRFGSFVYAYASDWFFSFISHMDLSCIRTLDLHLACFLQLLCWILVVFVHWIFMLHVSCTSCVGSYLYSYIGSSFGMFLAPPVLDLSCIRTLDLHLACFLHLLCWILAVFIHCIFGCFVSVAILWIKPLISSPVYTGVLLLAQAAKPPAAMEPPHSTR